MNLHGILISYKIRPSGAAAVDEVLDIRRAAYDEFMCVIKKPKELFVRYLGVFPYEDKAAIYRDTILNMPRNYQPRKDEEISLELFNRLNSFNNLSEQDVKKVLEELFTSAGYSIQEYKLNLAYTRADCA